MNCYTSDLLCHFVGRSQPTDELRYKLLVKIIKEDGILYANINDSEPPTLMKKLNQISQNQGELFDRCDCVCFCDIPFESLGIHRGKYGSFGIGFEKSFLIGKGTRPVMYVPKNCMINDVLSTKTPKNPDAYFDTLLNQASGVLGMLMMLDQVKPLKEQFDAILSIGNSDLKETVQKFVLKPIGGNLNNEPFRNILVYLFSAWATQCEYIKIYDDSLEDDNPYNYYMEREWRCTQNVCFSLQDINTVYLPDYGYQERFIQDVPQYRGEIQVFNK